MNERQQSLLKRSLIFLGFILFIVIMRYVVLPRFISFDLIKENRLYLRSLIDSHYVLSVLLFILAHIVVVTLSLPLVALFTIVGGYLFGAVLGTVFTVIGATTGAIFAFLMFRYLIGASVQEKYKTQLASFNKSMQEDGIYYLLSIHFIALIPFFMVNILASFTQVSLWTFIWTTALGIVPVSLVFAYAGEQFGTIESLSDIFSWNLIVAFSLLALLALAPTIKKRFFKHN